MRKRFKAYTPCEIAWRFRSRDKHRPNLCFPMIGKDDRVWATDGHVALFTAHRKPGHAGRWIDHAGRVVIMEATQPDGWALLSGPFNGPSRSLDCTLFAPFDDMPKGVVKWDARAQGAVLSPMRLAPFGGRPDSSWFDAAIIGRVAKAFRDMNLGDVMIYFGADPLSPCKIESSMAPDIAAVVMPLRS